jgi:subtilisin
MLRFARAAAAVVVFAGALTFAELPTSVAAPPDSFIVVYKDSVDEPAKTADLERRHGFKSDFRYQHAIKGFAAILPPRIREKIAKDPDVAFISPDGDAQAIAADQPVAVNETVPTGALRIESATATSPTFVHTPSAVNVAVIDTGVDLTHPDLNVVAGTSCIKGRKANDDNGHGTHVAGIIAAKNNGGGVIGVAPGTTIYSVKVLDRNGRGTWSQVICGIDWVFDNSENLNIKVANLSLGGTGGVTTCDNDALHRAICRSVASGVTYSVAAGNSGTDIAGAIPANFQEVVTVTAMSDNDGKAGGTGGAPTCRSGESDDKYATFSNYATSAADQIHTIAAPGVCIRSDWKDGGYNTMSGTSMAAPHVAAVVALCITEGTCTGLAPAGEIVEKLRSDATAYGFTGDPRSPVAGRYYGYLVSAGKY